MFDHNMIEPFRAAKRAFLAHQFHKVDQILPGLDSQVVLANGAPNDTIEAFIKWAKKHRPADLFISETLHDI